MARQGGCDLRWKPGAVESFMALNGIDDRSVLAKRLPGVSPTTIYRQFDEHWGGFVSLRMLLLLSNHFRVPLHQLVAAVVSDPIAEVAAR